MEEHIIEIHSDVINSEINEDDLSVNNNILELEVKVKTAISKLEELIKSKKKMENEKKEMEKEKHILEESLNTLKSDVKLIKSDELLSLTNLKKNLDNRLIKCVDEQTKNIIIARRSYHNINNKYWWSSIFILVFSSVITFIEAVRLIIENAENKKIKELTYIISISSILIGILITIVTGYIKFNDYQNKLEIISSRLSLLLQYQKKFEVIKFQLSTYSLPELDNDKDTIQCTKHNILSKELLKEFTTSLNRLEEDIQNNELLKYITDSCEFRYYREYVDTYIKDMMYNNYIKTLTEYLHSHDINYNTENTERIYERISKIVNNQRNKKKIKMDFELLKELKQNLTSKIH
tara:strand:+ start:5449 stop:6498 length:1050 start_codon:yes stop_codon:yes gene_type:complete